VSEEERQSDDDDVETGDMGRVGEETGDDKDYVSASLEDSKETGDLKDSEDETEEEDEGSTVEIKGHDLLRFSSRTDDSVSN